MQSGKTFCPIHEYETYACDAECQTRRREFKKLAHALNVYFHDRMCRGVGYVPATAVRRCTCMHLFVPWRQNQQFCSVECRRRVQWARRYDKRHGVAA